MIGASLDLTFSSFLVLLHTLLNDDDDDDGDGDDGLLLIPVEGHKRGLSLDSKCLIVSFRCRSSHVDVRIYAALIPTGADFSPDRHDYSRPLAWS